MDTASINAYEFGHRHNSCKEEWAAEAWMVRPNDDAEGWK
jgi:hypothetical protein